MEQAPEFSWRGTFPKSENAQTEGILEKAQLQLEILIKLSKALEDKINFLLESSESQKDPHDLSDAREKLRDTAQEIENFKNLIQSLKSKLNS